MTDRLLVSSSFTEGQGARIQHECECGCGFTFIAETFVHDQDENTRLLELTEQTK